MRKQLNEQWCEFHWAPYRDERPRPNAVLASVKLMHTLCNLPRFTEAVAQKMRLYGSKLNDATQMAMEDMCRIDKKSVCCILGDEVMSALLIECRATSGEERLGKNRCPACGGQGSEPALDLKGAACARCGGKGYVAEEP